MNILVVRLGALGDVVHAIPAVAALRRAYPDARIDWLVDAKHVPIVELVTAVDRAIVVERPAVRGWIRAIGELRATPYEIAIDLQGLMKSAVLARASGARRVVGFSIWHLREKTARPFYSDVRAVEGGHVIAKNLRLLETVGVHETAVEFPLADVASAALDELRRRVGGARLALINPGAAWPNKRWPADRFGEIATFVRDVSGLLPVVLWGPGEELLARSVVAATGERAVLAPPTTIADVLALSRAAALMISGDTGPLHIAIAAGTPVVALFGPTDPARNGPYPVADVSVSRYDSCGCHYDRRCHQARWCLADVGVTEVCAAITQRLRPAAG